MMKIKSTTTFIAWMKCFLLFWTLFFLGENNNHNTIYMAVTAFTPTATTTTTTTTPSTRLAGDYCRLSVSRCINIGYYHDHSRQTATSLKATTDNSSSSSRSDKRSTKSELERLLAKAAQLRAEAAKAEQEVHLHEVEKRQHHNAELDKRIDYLLFSSTSSSSSSSEVDSVVERLESKRLSFDTLKDIVQRLYERELQASGKELVEYQQPQQEVNNNNNNKNTNTSFQRVSKGRNEQELERLNGKIDLLIQAIGILDENLKKKKEAQGDLRVNHLEADHFGGLTASKRLEMFYHELRREQEEQFQKRQEEFREAQRIHKKHNNDKNNNNKKNQPPPPPKQKDHMMHP